MSKSKGLVFLTFVLLLLASCSDYEEPRSEQVLGTVCSVNAFEDGSKALYDAIFRRLFEIDSLFTTSVDSSQIQRINKNAGKGGVPVDKEVYDLIEKALYYADLSGGLFDPTIGPLVSLWGINTPNARIPSQEEIDAAMLLVGYKNVTLYQEGSLYYVALEKEGMSLDLGGIAKGYAADEVCNILCMHGVRRAVVDLGGNIALYGSKKNGEPWKIGIKNPAENASEVAAVLTLYGSANIVTSGTYERYFEVDGKRYHHIINPFTGYPSDCGIESATIVASSSLAGDALSTIAFLLGEEKFRVIEEKEGVSSVFIASDGTITGSWELMSTVDF